MFSQRVAGGDALRSLYMVQSLGLGRGALSALVLMAVGESTSVLQNGWYIARAMRRRSPVRGRPLPSI